MGAGRRLWSVEPLHGLRQRWAELWPDWTLEFWGDDWARQAVHDPDRLYDSILPRAIIHGRGMLAERLQFHWPVRSTMLQRGTTENDLQMMYDGNFGGIRSRLDTGVTAEEIERIAALLRGPQTIP